MQAKSWSRRILWVVVCLGALMYMIPFLWTVLSSLKGWWEIRAFPPTLFPEKFIWENYVGVFDVVPFHHWMWNTFVIGVLSVIGAALSSSVVGFAFSRFRFPGRGFMFMICLGTMMLPAEITLIPRYVLFARLHWIDTWKPLIIPWWFGGGAFNVFLMRQFFLTLPRDLDEAAMMDGAGPLVVYSRILLPLCVPALMTVIVIGFIGSWNNFMEPMIILNSTEKLTVSVGINLFGAQHGAANVGARGKPTDHLLMAAATLATLPPILIFVAAQRYFVRGIVMSGMKGAGV